MEALKLAALIGLEDLAVNQLWKWPRDTSQSRLLLTKNSLGDSALMWGEGTRGVNACALSVGKIGTHSRPDPWTEAWGTTRPSSFSQALTTLTDRPSSCACFLLRQCPHRRVIPPSWFHLNISWPPELSQVRSCTHTKCEASSQHRTHARDEQNNECVKDAANYLQNS